MRDVTGEPRSTEQIEEALRVIKSEMVKNPMAMSKDGMPLTIVYFTIKDALTELLERRAKDTR